MATVNDPAATYQLQQDLVDLLLRRGVIKSPEVELAFRAVPRHLFLPGVAVAQVYRDEVIPTKYEGNEAVSSSSQPAMMAIMLEQLQLRPGQRVLEIGAGSGYNAALIAQIVGPTGQVITIDIDAEMTRHARASLDRAGFTTVEVITGDGGQGYPPGAPYDRIILTVGAWDVLPAWREQLIPGGRLVLPLSFYSAQKSVALVREGDRLRSVAVTDCGFMRMRGPFAGPERWVPLPASSTARVEIVDESQDVRQAATRLMRGPTDVRETNIAVSLHELFGPLGLWLALHELLPFRLHMSAPDPHVAPALFTWPGEHLASVGIGVYTAEGLCLFHGHDLDAGVALEWERRFQLRLHSYDAAEALLARIQRAMRAWIARGRPESRQLQIWIDPAGRALPPVPNTFVIPKHMSTIRLRFS